MYILTCVRGETLADNISLHQAIEFGIGKASGEVPKMAEGTPLERVQVVNSGARVQIPPSPFLSKKRKKKFLTKQKRCDKIEKLLKRTSVEEF